MRIKLCEKETDGVMENCNWSCNLVPNWAVAEAIEEYFHFVLLRGISFMKALKALKAIYIYI